MEAQNRGLASPESMAPGITSMIRFSAISIDAIDKVSAIRTSFKALLRAMPFFKSGIIDSRYPKTNARDIESVIVVSAVSPNETPMIIPKSSPIAQPVKQWSVADRAIPW